MNLKSEKRVLVTGASGLLGSHIALLAGETSDAFALYGKNSISLPGCSSIRGDLADVADTARILERIQPSVVIHSAALTNVDECEDQKELAQALMVETTSQIAEWCGKHSAQFVYISTDSVFDGQKGNYSEEDAPNPVNAYAHAKRDGELAALRHLQKALIVRTNFYGWNHGETLKFCEWILGSLVKREPIYTFNDVYFSPLLVNDLAQTILDLVDRQASGLFHAGSRDHCSKSDFAQLLSELFSLKADHVSSISMDTFPFKAHRPKNTSLRVEKISRYLGREMPSVRDGLEKFKGLLDSGWVNTFKKNQPDWLKLIPAK